MHCLSNICWAFAKNAHRSPSLFEAVARQAERIASEGKIQEISNIVLAFAKSEHKSVASEEMFGQIARQHVRIVREGKIKEWINILWSFAHAQVKAGELFDAILAQKVRIIREGNVQDLSQILHAYSNSGIFDRDLFEEVGRRGGVEKWSEQHVANTLRSYAIAGFLDMPFVQTLWQRALDPEMKFTGERARLLDWFNKNTY